MKETITIEQLKEQKGKWAVWIDSEELYNELRVIFKMCSIYHGPSGYSNYGTYDSSHTLEDCERYWIKRGMPFFIINNVYEIY